jgi:hypothetical protein
MSVAPHSFAPGMKTRVFRTARKNADLALISCGNYGENSPRILTPKFFTPKSSPLFG